MAGRKDDARQILKRLKELSRHRYVSPYHTALMYIALGERDEAFAWLEKAYNDGGLNGSSQHLLRVF
jgi:hypothetical protein